jgi:hypothetical protein
MGYWSAHPMAGDKPLDVEDFILSEVFSKREMKKDMHFDETLVKIRLEKNIKKLYPSLQKLVSDGLVQKCSMFVLPFLLAKYKIQIKDKSLSDAFKNIIGDGGAEDRGYPEEECTPTKENNYNGFQSPADYAAELYDKWDDLISGALSFDELSTSYKERNLRIVQTKIEEILRKD